MALITHIENDLFNAPMNYIICHQVNTKAKMGKGIALTMKKLYPDNYAEYSYLCEQISASALLGSCYVTKQSDGRHIANLFAQNGYGTDTRYTNYEALATCLEKLGKYARDNELSLAFPYKIGCNNAGGNWKIVLTMIEELCYGVDILIYKERTK